MSSYFTKNKVSIFLSSKGVRTCTVNSILLHSKYNPVQEAHRNMQSQLSQYTSVNPEHKKLVILIGAGLGYELHAIQELVHDCSIIPVYLDTTLFLESNQQYKILYDTTNNDLTATLRRMLRTVTISSPQDIMILFWPPSRTIWPALVLTCFKEVRESIALHYAENNTIRHFISQWMRNACMYYVHIAQWGIPHASTDNVVVIAAGPELNTHITDLQTCKENFVIIAVSSALQCLFAHHIYPDIIVHQDSSYYASRYLIDFPEWYRPCIAFPMHASRSSLLRTLHRIVLTTNQETDILLKIHKDTTRTKISAHGTVVGSALELGWMISTSKVYLIGFDLSVSLKGTHCHPHLSIPYYACNRVNSFETKMCTKYYATPHVYTTLSSHMTTPLVLRQDNALKLYADWFRKWKHPWKTERTIIVSTHPLPHYEHIPRVSTLPKVVHAKTPLHITTYSSPFTIRERKKRLRELIAQWRHTWETLPDDAPHGNDNALSEMERTILELKRVMTTQEFHALISRLHSTLHDVESKQ